MPSEPPKKILYLFGAGATHAELKKLYPHLVVEKRGLLIGHVSSRVIEKARKDRKYLKDVTLVSGTSGSLNIELLISLLENSKIHNWAHKTSRLKRLVEQDIKTILTRRLRNRFFLHKALLEFHAHPKARAKEELIGLISLNYDDVLDQAYKQLLGREVNYCFSLRTNLPSSNNVPLLKLHGSFNWKNQHILHKRRTIEIIPLGSTKSYLHTPYGFIWNRALDVLAGCDTLRVIGCSLSPNDGHLIDLLFKAHLERSAAFSIEVIDWDLAGKQVNDNYGFFPGIKKWSELSDPVMPEPVPVNPFEIWLKYKSADVLGGADLRNTRYLRRVMS
jgi:hypothetical protein